MRTLLTSTSLAKALFASTLIASAQGQGFGGQQVITQAADNATAVYATDLDGDGDADVLSASQDDFKIAWYKNLGGGVFGGQQIITQTLNEDPADVLAADLDGDGDADVVWACWILGQVAWHENLGGGSFGPKQVITQAASGVRSVFATDLDGDGGTDVLSASPNDNKVAWYKNLGGGVFGPQQVITQEAAGAEFVFSSDLDGDGDFDVLSASGGDAKVAWYENMGSGAFGAQQVVAQDVPGVHTAYAADLDGDGDPDIMSAGEGYYAIAWYKNEGNGSFVAQQQVAVGAGITSLYAAEIDGDGDKDLLVTRPGWDSIEWCENLGSGSFGPPQMVTQAADDARTVYATDLDGDGDADVLAAGGSKVAWYPNDLPADCNGNGSFDAADIATGSSLDCNNNGIPDECDIAYDPTIDANLNGVPDTCEVVGSRYWILSPVTDNWYAVTDGLRADEAAQVAINWGGDLVTINDQAENDWLAAQFGNDTTPFWIGLNDVNQEGLYSWLSGEPVNYTNWRAGEPDDAPGLFGADFTVMFPATGKWLDEPADALTFAALPRGVVELVSSDCDSNGIPDTYELLQNPSLDCDGNGAIDSCEIIADTSLDCDADQTLDVCQITADPSLDWNGDGLIDSCSGGNIVYCDGNQNAAGLVGRIAPQGSPLVADDAFTLYASDLPVGQPGMFIMSRASGYVNPFGGGAGVLCLGPPIRRFNPTAGFPLQFTGTTGEITLTPPIAQFPGPNPIQPGDVIYFQLWHREFDPATGTPRSNTTDGISVMFR